MRLHFLRPKTSISANGSLRCKAALRLECHRSKSSLGTVQHPMPMIMIGWWFWLSVPSELNTGYANNVDDMVRKMFFVFGWLRMHTICVISFRLSCVNCVAGGKQRCSRLDSHTKDCRHVLLAESQLLCDIAAVQRLGMLHPCDR